MERNAQELATLVARIWTEGSHGDPANAEVVRACIDLLDRGVVRVAEPEGDGWRVNEWVKQAILLYFRIQGLEPVRAGDLEFYDKIATKRNFEQLGVRAVPPAVARYGSYVAPGCVLMPSYVNIGAYVGEGSMVDTWATVGSCAQIGSHVHLSGGVGIGGVLEPMQAQPVVVEDHCFIGSRCIVVEGARIAAGAVLGANVVITSSTKIIDVSGSTPVEYRGYVPPNSVVIPGVYMRTFAAGEFGVPSALIVGQRKESTDRKTSLNDALREFNVAV